MDPAVAGWVATAFVSCGTVVGWIILIRKNGQTRGATDADVAAQVKNTVKTLDSLPCISNPTYREDMGRLQEQVRGIDEKIDDLKKGQEDQAKQSRADVGELHLRIDKVINERKS